jgi:hypothetical protein
MAWPCGFITSAAVILTVAKGVWDWPGKLQTVSARIKDYSEVVARYRTLVEDISYQQRLLPWHNTTYVALAADDGKIPVNTFPLSETERRTIQDRLKNQIKYHTRWQWKDT